MSAADTYNAVCVFALPEFPSFPTFQCQKLRLFLAHAAGSATARRGQICPHGLVAEEAASSREKSFVTT